MQTREILLVDDNPEDVELTVRALRKHHLLNEVRVARDGQEALDYLFGNGAGAPAGPPPHVILLDLKMPKVGGFEVLQRLKASPELKEIPVVVLTSSREHPDVKRAYELGANSYIVKPVEFDKFIAAVVDVGLYWLLLNQPAR